MQTIELPAAKGPIVCSKTTWVRAKVAGLFRYTIANGQFIQKNEIIGSITDPYGTMSVRIRSPKAGYIIGINQMPVVNQGDALLHVAIA